MHDQLGLLSVADEASVFWFLRRRIGMNLLWQTIQRSRLRLVLASTLTLCLWFGLFVLFYMGFEFLAGAIPEPSTHDETVRAVYSVFFASLTVMLVISTGIILYGGLYRSPEVRFLLTTPARVERIFLHKFQEGMLFASWGFLLLGSPMMVAYGVVAEANWYYYAILVPFMAAFVYIPGSLGAILCLLLMRYLPANRVRLLMGLGLFLSIATLWMAWSLATHPKSDLLTPGWFLEMLSRLRTSETRLLPSWWLSSGLLEAARSGVASGGRQRALFESVLFMMVTIANALALHQLALFTAGRTFRASFAALAGERSPQRKIRALWIDRALLSAAFPLSTNMRLLIVKDLKLFRRDPVQWSQFLIFFGLLALYFLNTRQLSYDMNYAAWVNMISFLNLAVVGLILSTFTTRFIFPMISLEGRRFWILGRLPVERSTILWSKFLFASFGSLIPCAVLVLLSDLMLRVSALVVGVHLLACALLCSGLSGIAVGLGAKMPNLRDESPARIAAGFGGTLNLVLSAAYIVVLVVLTTVPCYFYLLAVNSISTSVTLDPHRQLLWLIAGVAGSMALGITATVVPLRMGFKAFRAMEF
jgi:ABC-2 type transport system permease protein